MFEKELMRRCKAYLEDSGLPVARMCAKLNISTSAFYQWRKNRLNLSPERLLSIDNYLKYWGY